jgi:hypothetical protein
MKKFKEQNYKFSYLLAISMYPIKNKPGQNQKLTPLSCILTVNKQPDKINLLLSMTPQLSFWRVIYV